MKSPTVKIAAAALLCLALCAQARAQSPRPGAAPPHAFGEEGAPVTVEIFNDYQCPACAAMNEEVKEFERKYRGGVRVIFRNFPLAMHRHAPAAARAAEAAGAQGRFREMLEIIYARQKDWAESADPTTHFDSYARRLGLDPARFRTDAEGTAVDERIGLDVERGRSLKLLGTPTLYVNGAQLPGLPTRGEIHAAIEKAGATPAPDAPRFEDYPAREVYKGPVAPVRLDGPRARRFRTRLVEDSRRGPNFAGHYTVVSWGCGTGCAQTAVVDARTGRVYFPPVEYTDIPEMENEAARRRIFRLDSKLLVLTQNYYDASGRYTAYYYLFERNRFRLLRKAEESRPQPPGQEN